MGTQPVRQLPGHPWMKATDLCEHTGHLHT